VIADRDRLELIVITGCGSVVDRDRLELIVEESARDRGIFTNGCSA